MLVFSKIFFKRGKIRDVTLNEPVLEEVDVEGLELCLVATKLLHAAALRPYEFRLDELDELVNDDKVVIVALLRVYVTLLRHENGQRRRPSTLAPVRDPDHGNMHGTAEPAPHELLAVREHVAVAGLHGPHHMILRRGNQRQRGTATTHGQLGPSVAVGVVHEPHSRVKKMLEG